MSNDLHDENNEIENEEIELDADNIDEAEDEMPLQDEIENENVDETEGKKKNSDKRARSLKIFSIASVFIAIAIIIGLNLMFDSALGKKLQWDMTSTQQFSIGDTTKEILADLQKDVEIVGLFPLNESTKSTYSDFISMLEDYERHSNGRVTVRYVDPTAVPTIITELDPNKVLELARGHFAVRCGDKVRKIDRNACYNYDQQYYQQTGQQRVVSNSVEANFSGAITSVISDDSFKAYFVTNHSENSHAQVGNLLAINNFTVDTLDTTVLEAIPEDCSLLIYNNPKKDLSQNEADVLMNYMQEQGGRLIVIAGYDEGQLIELPRLNEVLHFMNLDLSNAIIAEFDANYVASQQNPFLMHFMSISSAFRTENTSAAVMSFTRAVMEYNNPKEYIIVSPILTTSETAFYLENADVTQLETSTPGRLNGGMFSENNGWSKQSKAAVFGSSSIADDALYATYSLNFENAQLFRKTAMTMVEAVDPYLPIQAKTYPTDSLEKLPTATEATLILLIFAVFIPLALIVVAVIVYNKRKKL